MIALAALVLVFSPRSAHAEDTCRLTVGWEHWHPFIYFEDGEFRGSEFELLTKLAQAADCELLFREVPWVRALKELEQGRLDLLYGASRTKEREAYAAFSEPYRYDGLVLISLEDPGQGGVSLDAFLKGLETSTPSLPLGLIRGFHYGDKIQPILDRHDAAELYATVRSDDELLRMLKAGRLSAYLLNTGVASSHFNESGGALKITAITEDRPEPMHLMFSRDVPLVVRQTFDTEIGKLPKR